jgi:perosamine synthetase
LEKRSIPVAGPSISQKEIDYVTDAVKNGWYNKANYYQEQFEKKFATYVGRKYAIALPSCTSALHLALLALEIKPGNEVIVPEITWIASAAPITYLNATPIFADIDEKTWCLSTESFKQHLTEKTRAVIVVDLYGNMPVMEEILEIAAKRNIYVIEDAAEALGSEYHSKKAGSFGDVSVFSFHGSKTLTTGEGGMLVTDSEDIYKKCLFLRDHGRSAGPKIFWNEAIAYKYKMSNLQAALGLAQLERIAELVERKREIFFWYQSKLSERAVFTLNYEAPISKNSYWMVTLLIDSSLGIAKEYIIQQMNERLIDCRPFFYPLSSLPAYRNLPSRESNQRINPVSYRLSPFGINLPCGMNMTPEKVEYVCEQLIDIVIH